MSITPKEPPTSVNSDAGKPAMSRSSSTRLLYGSWRVARAAASRVWGRLRRVAGRLGGRAGTEDGASADRPPGEDRAGSDETAGTRLRPVPVARLGIGPGGRGEADEGDRARLAGESGPVGPELPPRPDLEATETDQGLELRRPGREEAYLASDEWQTVRR